MNMENERKKDLKFIIIFIIITSISVLYLTQSTLAKYRKQTRADINFNIAKWNIKINNQDINNKVVLTDVIIPKFTGNEFIKDSVIAPGSVGYCDIIIDATNVDIDFIYELTSTVPPESSIPDLKITSYIINPSDTNTIEIPYDEMQPITGSITRNTKDNVIRIYIKWEEENGIMDNKADTDAAINPDSKALVNASLKFQQKTK